MYEKLVKRLREYAKEHCPLDRGSGICGCIDAREAADAIEELSELADAIPHVCECCIGCELEKKNGGCDNSFVLSPKRAMQYLIKPRWIPVTERLPEDEEMVLCFTPVDGFMFVGFHISYKWGSSTVSKWRIITAMRSTKDITKKVTHWMPLPEPPKEDAE